MRTHDREYGHIINKYGQSAKTEDMGDCWLAYFDRRDYCAQADTEQEALARLQEMEIAAK